VKGRPRKPITIVELEQLCSLSCTDEEIAAFFEVDVRTIERRKKEKVFGEVVARGRAKGRISLRRKQMEAAQAGDRTMLIWLGKQLLGQTDILRNEHSFPASGPKEITDVRTKLARLIDRRASDAATPEVSGEPD
jgi:hypothetical protein